MGVAIDPSSEEVDVHEPLLSDRPERDRTLDDIILPRRAARDALPGTGLELLAAQPEAVVALPGGVYEVDAVGQSWMGDGPCRVGTPVDRLTRWVVHKVAVDLEAADRASSERSRDAARFNQNHKQEAEYD